jgi:hypothetical protein
MALSDRLKKSNFHSLRLRHLRQLRHIAQKNQNHRQAIDWLNVATV